ncbi:MAG: hypothetical protein ACK4RT_11605 [Erythrobacter sp.]
MNTSSATATFADLRVQRPTTTAIGISDTVTPEPGGPASALFGLHGFEDEIVALAIHEIRL